MENSRRVFVSVAAMIAGTLDGRSFRSDRERVFTMQHNVWREILAEAQTEEGWFVQNLRMNRASFEFIVQKVESRWAEKYAIPPTNSAFKIMDRTAIFIHYVTHESNLAVTGTVFGLSRASVSRFVDQLLNVVVLFKAESIRLPQTAEAWLQARADFASRGFPGMVGAIDGSLVELERGGDFEGFYCRKGFPAFNVLAVVDHQKRFIAAYISRGSNNDRGCYNDSDFGRNIQNMLPNDCYILGDAGYTQYTHLMTPYPITLNMPDNLANYNLTHSRARIVVEMAFGLFKGKFRIFKKPLDIKTKEKAGKVIISTMILHNWLIDSGNTVQDNDIAVENWMHLDAADHNPPTGGDEALARRNEIMNALPNVLFE
jgi:hypothetical protein